MKFWNTCCYNNQIAANAKTIMKRNEFFKRGFSSTMLMAPEAILNQGGSSGSPAAFQLGAPYPYPFYAVATVPFSIPKPGLVRLELYDANGSRIHTFLNKKMDAGNHRCFLDRDALKLDPGSYVCIIHWSAETEEASAFQLIGIP